MGRSEIIAKPFLARSTLRAHLLFGLILCFLGACAVSPLGRKQLQLIPEQQMDQMGRQAFQDLKQKGKIERSPAINRYVKCIANALLKQASTQIPPSGWEIVVFREASANAFALPGGRIGVHTGMLKVATDANQLAAVVGHEIGHVMANHGNERVSETIVVQSGLAAAGALMKEKKGTGYSLLMAGLGLGAQFGILLPHSRTHESEADIIGLDLMAKAGFDPRGSVELGKNMAKAGGGQPPEFLSTHPAHGSRIGNLNRNMAQALEVYRSAQAQGQRPNCAH